MYQEMKRCPAAEGLMHISLCLAWFVGTTCHESSTMR